MLRIEFKIEYIIFQFLWVFLLFPKEVQLIAFSGVVYILLIKIKKFNTGKIDLVFLTFSLFICIYISSIVMNIYFYDHDRSRVLATINTVAIWIVGLLYYYCYSKLNFEKNKIQYYSFINLAILFIMSFVYTFSSDNLAFFGRNLVSVDWINGLQDTRLMAFMEYSNLIIFFYLLQLPSAYNYVKRKYGKLLSVFFLWLSCLPAYLSGSRSGILIVFALTLFISIYDNMKRRSFYVLAIGLVVVTIIILYPSIDYISSLYTSILDARSGSTGARSDLYEESIQKTLTLSPIFGMGIKDMFRGVIPFGSHSTYIGVFYRTGFLGLLVFMTAIGRTFFQIIKIRNVGFIIPLYFVGLLVFMALEDIDGVNWLLVLFFASIAIYQNKKTST